MTRSTEPPTTRALPTIHSHPSTEKPHSHPSPPPSTEKPHITYETTTQSPSREQVTGTNSDSAFGGQHGPGVAVIAGVSVSVVVLVVAAAVVVTAVVVYLVWKKQAPQSRGFTKLTMTSTEKNAVAV